MRRLHSDHATHAAARRLIPPTLRLCCLGPSVTTPLYSTTVSQALRQTLRSQAVSELPRMPKRELRRILLLRSSLATPGLLRVEVDVQPPGVHPQLSGKLRECVLPRSLPEDIPLT